MRNRLRACYRFVVALTACLGAALATAGELLQIRWSDGPSYTRVVLDLSDRTAIKQTEHLANPDRFYIDLVNTRRASNFKNPQINSEIVSKIRLGQQTGGVLRVVLDLKTENKPKVSTLGAYGNVGYRIILDVPRTTVRKDCPNELPKDVVVLIDAGHGGEDPGATAANGHHEKHIVLSIARYMKQYLERNPGFKAVLSRDGDYEVPLETRKLMAEQERAHLFVSVHADAFRTPQPKGASVFVLSEGKAKTELTKWLEENENKSDWVGGVSNWLNTDCFEPSDALLMLNEKTQQEMLVEAIDIGKKVVSSLDEHVTIHPKSYDRKTGRYKVSDAGFVVLKATSVPSILVEAGFLSNPEEGRLLSTKSYQQDVAQAITRGIVRHFCAKPPWHTDLQTGVKKCKNDTLTHVVRPGDTLSEIAHANNTSVKTIRQMNNLDRDVIFIGQRLTIPAY